MSNVIYVKRFDQEHWIECPMCLGSGCLCCDQRGGVYCENPDLDRDTATRILSIRWAEPE